MKTRRFACLAALALGLCLASPLLAAKGSGSGEQSSATAKPTAPEFGPSVVFDRADGAIQLSDLRGKLAVLVFFQSW